MGITDFVKRLFIKDNKFRQYRITDDGRAVEIRYKKPLYRINGRVYWKGIPVDDDEFDMLRQYHPEEIRAYNYHVNKANKRIRYLNRHRKRWRKRVTWKRKR